jgi:serine/threonine protein kinase
MEAIIAGDYKFEPQEYWANVSDTAKNFVTHCLTIDPAQRPTAAEALQHGVCISTVSFLSFANACFKRQWLDDDVEPHFVPVSS